MHGVSLRAHSQIGPRQWTFSAAHDDHCGQRLRIVTDSLNVVKAKQRLVRILENVYDDAIKPEKV